MGAIVPAAPWDDSVVTPRPLLPVHRGQIAGDDPTTDGTEPDADTTRVGVTTGGRRTRRSPLVARATPLILALVCAGGVVSGCDLRLETAPGALPELSGSARLRDAAARSESAAATRAQSLSQRVASCQECRTALDAVAQDSSTRLEALGGLWDPWNGVTPQDAQAPAPVADAPLEVGEFATWMALSAQRDLAAATDPDIDGAQARTVASVALGRLVSARSLADAYDVDLDAGLAQVGVLDARLTDILRRSGTEGGGWDLAHLLEGPRSGAEVLADGAVAGSAEGDGDRAQSGDPQGSESGSGEGDTSDAGTDTQSGGTAAPSLTEDIQTSPELAAAVRTWDCVAQTLPRAGVVDRSIDDASPRADRLLTRASAALDAGVADTREERCRLSESTIAELDAAVLSADLDLFTSESEDVRRYGVTLVTQDLNTWFTSGDALPGALPGTAAQ